jgi:integrase
MASFRQQGNSWQTRVRRKGYSDITKSFNTRQDAERWARSVEVSLDRGTYVDPTEAERVTLDDLIGRYIKEVLPSMKGYVEDSYRLKAIQRRDIAKINMARLSSVQIAAYRDHRLTEVAANTVIRELAYLSSVINNARREWGINITNPVQMVRNPSMPQGRNRVITEDELQRLLEQLEPTGRRNPWMKPLVLLALETGMRRGELLQLRWTDINLQNRTATLWETKNGERRVVPLSSKAIDTLQKTPRSLCGRVFPLSQAAQAKAFKEALKRSKLDDLHFHDLRHTAITHMAKKLPNVIELAAVSGHKSLRMLQRYYHPDAVELAAKLG